MANAATIGLQKSQKLALNLKDVKMGINELVTFIALVCNLDSPALPFHIKQQCIDHYNNCMVESDAVINRRKINKCVDEAKKKSVSWR